MPLDLQSNTQEALMALAFNKFNFPDFDNFLDKTHKRSYPADSLIFSEGEVSDTLYFIISGSISVILTDDTNREIIIAYLSPGDFFGEMSLFDINMSRSASALLNLSKDPSAITHPNGMQIKITRQDLGKLLIVHVKWLAEF